MARCWRVQTLFSTAEHQVVIEAAKREGKTFAAYVRDAAVIAARAELAQKAELDAVHEHRGSVTEGPDHCTTCGMPHDEEWEEETHP